MVPYSQRVGSIFDSINYGVKECYSIANKAKTMGFDPDSRVKIPLALNMAERVEGLISSVAPEVLGKGIPLRIQELEKQYGSQDWRIALVIAEEVAKEKFCKFETKKKAIETGIRVGFAYVTVGVVSSPLEGFIEVQIRKRKDNQEEYFALIYGGPIRSAGGTGASVSVLIADYVRKKLGYATYDPTEQELKRACSEIADYHERVTNLQYLPSEEEIIFLTRNLPVQVDGDPSEKYDVSNYKDLDRRVSNKLSNGFCLVTAECLSLKAPKVWKQLAKWGKDMDMEQWMFMEDFVKLQKEIKARGAKVDSVVSVEKVKPDTTYIKDLVAGRPIFTYPLRNGGFRLRYGRGRCSGFSSDSLNPATMVVVDNFIAVGTQFKTERPGKSTTLNVCDTIDGPIVKLKNGNVVYLNNFEEAKKVFKEIDEIIYLGDILINWGDFQNRAHKLLPCGFVEEWWVYYAQKVFDKVDLSKDYLDELYKFPMRTFVSFDDALKFSRLGVPMHPKYIFYWKTLNKEQFLHLFNTLKSSVISDGKIIVTDFSVKRELELIGCVHSVVPDEYILIEGDTARALAMNLSSFKKELVLSENVMDMVNSVSEFVIKDKCGYFIGARMGRPEKAKMRKMIGNPHTLFPVGDEGGRLRCFQSALDACKVTAQFPIFFCEKCGKDTIFGVCEVCNEKTKRKWFCRGCNKNLDYDVCEIHGKLKNSVERSIDIKYYFYKALEKLGTRQYPDIVKGVRGLSSVEQIPEHLAKGISRAKFNINVNKDGTVRYDMTELPCTHFKPKEVGTSIEKLKSLGYDKDVYGNDLVDDNQVLELFAQDVILPACPESPEEGADEILFRVSGFIDEILEKLYLMEPYYKLKSKKDLVGHLIVAMSPHTSAGIVCRIVGFSKAQGLYAHPLLHSIMRRDADGDEAGCMLLLDTLLNFSKKYLPNTRGITQDAPLVLTGQLIPSEVDDMVFDMDIVDRYPLELYEAAEEYKNPWDVKIKKLGDCLGKEEQYEGMMFTHDTDDFNKGVLCSAYKILPTMKEKVLGQMEVARKLRAVDESDVARLIIERHFLRDIKGNLRKFSQQSFRCVKCNEIYRRPPLTGVCKCGGKLVFTISEGSITKYMDPATDLSTRYDLPPYLKQTLVLLQDRIESVFGKEDEKQSGLGKWF